MIGMNVIKINCLSVICMELKLSMWVHLQEGDKSVLPFSPRRSLETRVEMLPQ